MDTLVVALNVDATEFKAGGDLRTGSQGYAGDKDSLLGVWFRGGK